jgi:hypothetical protein
MAGMMLGGCGSSIPHAIGSASRQESTDATTPTGASSPCPAGEVLGTPGTCDTVNPNLNIQDNNAYKQYPPATQQQMAVAAPVMAAVSHILPTITAHPPITDASVSAYLHAALSMTEPRADIQVSSHAADGDGIGFGVFVPVGTSGACVHGWVSASDSQVAVDGISPDGGCLSLLGH